LVAGLASPAHAATPSERLANKPHRFVYALDSTVGYSSAFTTPARTPTPVGRLALGGYFWLYPEASQFTINVKDFGTPKDGASIPIYIVGSGRRVFAGCVPTGRPVTIAGVVAGEALLVFMEGMNVGKCDSIATVGVMTVRGASGNPPKTATAQAQAAPADRYLYALDGGTGSPQLEARVASRPTAAGRLAPLGHFAVVPRGSSIGINVDDFGTPKGGAIPVQMYSGGRPVFRGCVPVRTPFTVAGTRAGEPLWLYMGYEDLGFGCGFRASAGVVSVDGAASAANAETANLKGWRRGAWASG
jgi:hypothetical protein